MNDRRTRFIIFLFGDPHLLEGGEGSQDGSPNPDRIFSLRRGNYFDSHRGWCKVLDFFLHSISNSRKHGRPAGQNSVGVQVLTDINIALHDRVVGGLVDTARLHPQE